MELREEWATLVDHLTHGAYGFSSETEPLSKMAILCESIEESRKVYVEEGQYQVLLYSANLLWWRLGPVAIHRLDTCSVRRKAKVDESLMCAVVCRPMKTFCCAPRRQDCCYRQIRSCTNTWSPGAGAVVI